MPSGLGPELILTMRYAGLSTDELTTASYSTVVEILRNVGFEPQIARQREELVAIVKPFDLDSVVFPAKRPFSGPLREIFTAPTGDALLLTRAVVEPSVSSAWAFEALAVAAEPVRVIELVRGALDIEFSEGTHHELQAIKTAEDAIGEPSPNGKKAGDREYRNTIRVLFDDDFRRRARAGAVEDDDVAAALSNGLWLEAFAAEALEPFASRVWCGATVGPHEIDVVAVIADSTVIIECADDDVGQNDVTQVIGKARSISASDRNRPIRLITTRYVHPNVRIACEELRRRDAALDLDVIGSDSAWQISDALAAVSAQAHRRRLAEWFDD